MKTEVWIVINVYVLVASVRKDLKVEQSLSEMLRILSLMLFEKTLSKPSVRAWKQPGPPATPSNQPPLFDL